MEKIFPIESKKLVVVVSRTFSVTLPSLVGGQRSIRGRNIRSFHAVSSCGRCLIFFKAKEQQSRKEAFTLGLIVLMVVGGTSLGTSSTEIPWIKSQASDSGSKASVHL